MRQRVEIRRLRDGDEPVASREPGQLVMMSSCPYTRPASGPRLSGKLAAISGHSMKDAGPDEVTVLLAKWRQGSQDAPERLMEVVQSELRRLAASYLRRERPGHTLQPTAVNEAYLPLMPQRRVR